ncbi:DUF1398 domain-containing protein [Pollutimonas sp. M17]|uniref:DUF1398 domain-containing protein n=1 Tax=Pollutimonas sp. M17 TaxID=2962065 RepID=UPI0021F44B4D|nr:DUF1398 family protein [Pollutimonas sp. M17]UYO92560.1 DUF1398 family protein [Pollutimonas sp. M17]
MNESTQSIIRETVQASVEGRIHFGQVIGQLVTAGVESYLADYRAHRIVYYLPDGQTLDVPLDMPDIVIADNFDAHALQAAIRGSQRGEVRYPEFKRLSSEAGCIGYTVWIAGRHVSYFGRRGETHVEKFPD